MGDDDGLMLNLSVAKPMVAKKNNVLPDKTERLPSFSSRKRSRPSESGSTSLHRQNRANNIGNEHQHTNKKGISSCLFTRNPEAPDLSEFAPDTKEIKEDKQVLFSGSTFHELPISKEIASNVETSLGSATLTTVQRLGIPAMLQGKDVLVKSATGSGKTLTYAVPIIEKLRMKKPHITRSDGPYVIILLPTRELALQCFEVLHGLCKAAIWVVAGVLVGGEKKKSEKARLRKGINILLATPGRLLDHMRTTQSLDLSHVEMLVLDEADRLLDLGFKESLTEIMDFINKSSKLQIQTALLSATLDPKVHELAKVCSTGSIFIDATKDLSAPNTDSGKTQLSDAEEKSQAVTIPSTLDQYFVIAPAKQRLIALHSFLKQIFQSSTDLKVIVFVSSRAFVDFLFNVLTKVFIPCVSEETPVMLNQLHGSMLQTKRQEALNSTKISKRSLLICTDVAARGLDLPLVNWIIQFTPATDVDEYLHRVGRTARIGHKGESLLYLMPSEAQYLGLLKSRRAHIIEKKIEDTFKAVTIKRGKRHNQSDIEDTLSFIQQEYEEYILSDTKVQELANAAYASFIQAYTAYPKSMKSIFHIKKLHLGHLAKSFGLRSAPNVVTKHGNNNTEKDTLKIKQIIKQKSKQHGHNLVPEHDSSVDTSGPVPKKLRKSGIQQKKHRKDGPVPKNFRKNSK